METLERYRDIIEEVLERIGKGGFSNEELRLEVVFDRKRDRYTVLTVGWDEGKPVCEADIHLEILNGKIWIQGNNTNVEIAKRLVAEGVPREHIVIGILSPESRERTEYAVA